MFLMRRITESKFIQQNELNKQKITERELTNLNQKINKLLSKLEEHDQEIANNIDEECVICITSKATISTFPCGHCVICRRCFVKTIQNAVSQKNLPLRCVVCRAKILRLKQTFNSPLAETNRSKYRSKRQTRTYGLKSTYQNNYQNTTGKSSYTKNNKKNLPEISLSSSSKSKCKKRIVQSTINQNNDQTNPIENRKHDLQKEEDRNSLNDSNSNKSTNSAETIENVRLDVELDGESKTKCQIISNTENQNIQNLVINNSIETENRKRIEKLNKLTTERSLNRTLKTKILNYFSSTKPKYEKVEINYSTSRNIWSNKLKFFKNKTTNSFKFLFSS